MRSLFSWQSKKKKKKIFIDQLRIYSVALARTIGRPRVFIVSVVETSGIVVRVASFLPLRHISDNGINSHVNTSVDIVSVIANSVDDGGKVFTKE